MNDLSWRATPAAVNDLEGDTCSCLCFFWRVTPAAVIDLSWRVAPAAVNDLTPQPGHAERYMSSLCVCVYAFTLQGGDV